MLERKQGSNLNLREHLEDGGQQFYHRLPAGVLLVLQLGHHKVQVELQLLPQRVVQQVLQVDLHRTKTRSDGRTNLCFRNTSACSYMSAVSSDHGVAPGDGQLGHLLQHLLHLWDDELPGQDGLEWSDT